jgi:hypothetical protein
MRSFYLCILFFAVALISNGQPPQKMSYQMVIRNSANVLVSNQQVSTKISIMQGSATGSVVFSEAHTAITNANGLMSIIIGAGNNISGSFAAIDWVNGPFFIKTETDPAGGTNYTITATAQLLSVPYALYAGNAPSKGKTYFVLEDTVTNAEAAARIAEDAGEQTQFVWIKNTKLLTSLDLSKITSLTELIITGNSSLAQINLPNLKNVYVAFNISSNAALTSLSFPQLHSISTSSSPYTSISGNPALISISFPSLEKERGNLFVTANSALQSLSTPVLKSTDGLLNITANTALTTIDMPALVYSSPFINGASLTTILFPLLIRSDGYYGVTITGNNIVTLDLSSLERSSVLSIQGTSISNLSLPQLNTVDGGVNVSSNSMLTNISIPALTRFGLNGTGSGGYAGSAINFSSNALPSSAVNYLLSKLVSSIPPVKHQYIYLNQTPAAPPTGQGVTDKATLQARPNYLTTD